ncbi:MAG TPA: nuclear transport factor 2 family protein [Solirubrobacteraceae bacterium]|jgi:3-phenylpropionate/cinnamic acid dioxygenase small subunit
MAQETAVLERLARLEDTLAIQRLLIDYGLHLDARDLRAYSRLFCEDGEWTGATGTAVGPDAIQAMLEAELPGNPPAPGATTWHVMANPAIDVDGDSATSRVMWILVRRDAGDAPGIAVTGHYEDVLVRENGAWRFKRREAFVDIGKPIE